MLDIKHMKKRFTKEDLIKLSMAIDYLHHLADIDNNASFSINHEADAKIKDGVRPYMYWFETLANSLEELTTGKPTEYYQFR